MRDSNHWRYLDCRSDLEANMYMDDVKFWEIISQTASADQDEQEVKLRRLLTELSIPELVGFDLTYRRHKKRAHHWDAWAAAYIINGGCRNDGFDYFKDWLISRGEKVFEAALSDPETLIDIATPWDTEFEGFSYVVMDVLEEKGGEFPKLPDELLHSDPAGDDWNEDTVETKYPKLAEWVGAGTPTNNENPVHAPIQKKSFWQRLFGK